MLEINLISTSEWVSTILPILWCLDFSEGDFNITTMHWKVNSNSIE